MISSIAFEKADTIEGLVSIRALARVGAPYAMLLYERFLGRPFAGHRDSVSELIGDSLESAVEDVLAKAGMSYRKTKRAERLPGFDQAPDFIIPSEFNPEVVIEAKLTEDDGTARDKVTRIQHLAQISRDRGSGSPTLEVVACIGGRGFGVRREDMKKLLLATSGKVFTLRTLDRLIDCTGLQDSEPAEPGNAVSRKSGKLSFQADFHRSLKSKLRTVAKKAGKESRDLRKLKSPLSPFTGLPKRRALIFCLQR